METVKSFFFLFRTLCNRNWMLSIKKVKILKQNGKILVKKVFRSKIIWYEVMGVTNLWSIYSASNYFCIHIQSTHINHKYWKQITISSDLCVCTFLYSRHISLEINGYSFVFPQIKIQINWIQLTLDWYVVLCMYLWVSFVQQFTLEQIKCEKKNGIM